MNGRLKKVLLLALAVALLIGASFTQTSLNRDRERLGLTRNEPLENAPPMLAFTTVALGGFRGLIVNALWIRATELQDEDKFFEAQQLADWITKLEPHFVQVWVTQAWNMSYNISVKFKDFPDRWRWVKAGIELLRDEGLKYNPNEPLIYRELAWQFQHKMGANLDDANMYYKQQWAKQMSDVFGGDKPNFDEFINPQTDDARKRAQMLTNQFKMNPRFMKEVDERYGPLEWRLPEAHAIYWGALGLEKARENPTKINTDELTQLRRVIYQSMQLSFHRGKLVRNPFERVFEFSQNLDIFPKVNAAYEEMIADEPDPNQKVGFLRAQRNLIKDAVYYNYVQNRVADAAKWYRVLGEKFPDAMLIDGDTNSFPRNVTLDEYSLVRIQVDLDETDRNRMKTIIQGLIGMSYEKLILDEDDFYEGLQRIARLAWENYERKIASRKEAIGLAPLPEIAKELLERMLDPKDGLSNEARAVLRTKLGMEREPEPSPATTNAVPASTNSPAPAPNP